MFHIDILAKLWTQPTNHEMVMKYFKVLQLKKEISHLNIEVQHLVAWIDHNKKQLLTTEEKFHHASANRLVVEM